MPASTIIPRMIATARLSERQSVDLHLHETKRVVRLYGGLFQVSVRCFRDILLVGVFPPRVPSNDYAALAAILAFSGGGPVAPGSGERRGNARRRQAVLEGVMMR